MKEVDQVVQKALTKLSPKQQYMLYDLHAENPELFYKIMSLVSRYHRIIASGNKSAWKNMKKEERQLLEHISSV